MSPSDSTLPPRPGPEEQRNILCTILFLDLVNYSARSLNDQARIKQHLNAWVSRVLESIPADSRVAIDTGDGVALCFMADPQEALRAAMLLRDLLAQRYGHRLPARIGLHMGPVRVIEDVNGRVNVVGDGINVAQRIMGFAEPRQIVASRACFDILSRIAHGTAAQFRYAGVHEDKHGRIHELHILQDATHAVREPEATRWGEPACALSLPASVVAALEHALMRQIGPLARLLVHRALSQASSPQQLPQALAVHIEPPATREAFEQELARIVDGPSDAGLKAADGPPRR
jgi:class 3 adenylate cyclase